MKKKAIGIVLCAVLAMLVTVVAYAAASGYGMTYLPGTADTVTNMPAGDSGIGGQAYGVSAMVPRREGYEFLGWTLDYDIANTYTLNYVVFGDPTYGKPGDVVEPGEVTDIPAGSSVILVDPLHAGDVLSDNKYYTVHYVAVETGDEIMAPKIVSGIPYGTTVIETARDPNLDDLCRDRYEIYGDTVQTFTFSPVVVARWVFTGWCSDEACTIPVTEITDINADTTVYGKWHYEIVGSGTFDIYFFYERVYSYTVRYLDIETWEPIYADKYVTGVRYGTMVTESPLPCPPEMHSHYWACLNDFPITFEVIEDGNVILFLYYEWWLD